MSFTDSAKKLGQSAKNFGSSLGELGGNTASSAKGIGGFFVGVTAVGAKIVGSIASVPMFFARKGLDIASSLNRGSVTGKLIGAGILAGAVYGVYKGIKYALGYREQGDQIEAVNAEQQLGQERARGAMLDSHLEQATSQDMYRNQGNWTKSAPSPTSSYQQAAANSQSQPTSIAK